MRQVVLPVVAAAIFAFASASGSRAQEREKVHEIPALKSCIKEFNDPEMYNFLTFRNTCSEALSIVFVPKDGSGTGGTMDLRAGAKDSVGKSQEGKASPKIGTFDIYVCPLNYVPIGDDKQVVTKPGSAFKCEMKQPQPR